MTSNPKIHMKMDHPDGDRYLCSSRLEFKGCYSTTSWKKVTCRNCLALETQIKKIKKILKSRK